MTHIQQQHVDFLVQKIMFLQAPSRLVICCTSASFLPQEGPEPTMHCIQRNRNSMLYNAKPPFRIRRRPHRVGRRSSKQRAQCRQGSWPSPLQIQLDSRQHRWRGCMKQSGCVCSLHSKRLTPQNCIVLEKGGPLLNQRPAESVLKLRSL